MFMLLVLLLGVLQRAANASEVVNLNFAGVCPGTSSSAGGNSSHHLSCTPIPTRTDCYSYWPSDEPYRRNEDTTWRCGRCDCDPGFSCSQFLSPTWETDRPQSFRCINLPKLGVEYRNGLGDWIRVDESDNRVNYCTAHPCGSCVNNRLKGRYCLEETTCIRSNGYCGGPDKDDGICYGPNGTGNCDQCFEGFMGQNCEKEVTCNQSQGVCEEGSCFGPHASGHCTRCNPGFFGADCTCNGESCCDIVSSHGAIPELDGKCKCRPGFLGSTCDGVDVIELPELTKRNDEAFYDYCSSSSASLTNTTCTYYSNPYIAIGCAATFLEHSNFGGAERAEMADLGINIFSYFIQCNLGGSEPDSNLLGHVGVVLGYLYDVVHQTSEAVVGEPNLNYPFILQALNQLEGKVLFDLKYGPTPFDIQPVYPFDNNDEVDVARLNIFRKVNKDFLEYDNCARSPCPCGQVRRLQGNGAPTCTPIEGVYEQLEVYVAYARCGSLQQSVVAPRSLVTREVYFTRSIYCTRSLETHVATDTAPRAPFHPSKELLSGHAHLQRAVELRVKSTLPGSRIDGVYISLNRMIEQYQERFLKNQNQTTNVLTVPPYPLEFFSENIEKLVTQVDNTIEAVRAENIRSSIIAAITESRSATEDAIRAIYSQNSNQLEAINRLTVEMGKGFGSVHEQIQQGAVALYEVAESESIMLRQEFESLAERVLRSGESLESYMSRYTYNLRMLSGAVHDILKASRAKDDADISLKEAKANTSNVLATIGMVLSMGGMFSPLCGIAGLTISATSARRRLVEIRNEVTPLELQDRLFQVLDQIDPAIKEEFPHDVLLLLLIVEQQVRLEGTRQNVIYDELKKRGMSIPETEFKDKLEKYLEDYRTVSGDIVALNSANVQLPIRSEPAAAPGTSRRLIDNLGQYSATGRANCGGPTADPVDFKQFILEWRYYRTPEEFMNDLAAAPSRYPKFGTLTNVAKVIGAAGAVGAATGGLIHLLQQRQVDAHVRAAYVNIHEPNCDTINPSFGCLECLSSIMTPCIGVSIGHWSADSEKRRNLDRDVYDSGKTFARVQRNSENSLVYVPACLSIEQLTSLKKRTNRVKDFSTFQLCQSYALLSEFPWHFISVENRRLREGNYLSDNRNTVNRPKKRDLAEPVAATRACSAPRVPSEEPVKKTSRGKLIAKGAAATVGAGLAVGYLANVVHNGISAANVDHQKYLVKEEVNKMRDDSRQYWHQEMLKTNELFNSLRSVLEKPMKSMQSLQWELSQLSNPQPQDDSSSDDDTFRASDVDAAALWESTFHRVMDVLQYDLFICPRTAPRQESGARRRLLSSLRSTESGDSGEAPDVQLIRRRDGTDGTTSQHHRTLEGKNEAVTQAQAEYDSASQNLLDAIKDRDNACGRYEISLKELMIWAKSLHQGIIDMVSLHRKMQFVEDKKAIFKSRVDAAADSIREAIVVHVEAENELNVDKQYEQVVEANTALQESLMEEELLDILEIAQRNLDDYCGAHGWVKPQDLQVLEQQCDLRMLSGDTKGDLRTIRDRLETVKQLLDISWYDLVYSRQVTSTDQVLDVTEMVNLEALKENNFEESFAFSLRGPKGGKSISENLNNPIASFHRGGPFFCKVDNLELSEFGLLFLDKDGKVIVPPTTSDVLELDEISMEMTLSGPFIKTLDDQEFVYSLKAFEKVTYSYTSPLQSGACGASVSKPKFDGQVCPGRINQQLPVLKPSPYASWNVRILQGNKYLQNAHKVVLLASFSGVRNTEMFCRPEFEAQVIEQNQKQIVQDFTTHALIGMIVGGLVLVVLLGVGANRYYSGQRPDTDGDFTSDPKSGVLSSTNPQYEPQSVA